MSKRHLNHRQPEQSVAVLDPTESGPPTAEELGQVDNQEIAVDVNPTAPDCSSIVANLDRSTTWPAASLSKVNWPWSNEVDPVLGDIIGWNWQSREIIVVTSVPPVTEPWPCTLGIELRPMLEAWWIVKVFDLNSGERLEIAWYTRWNRAYQDSKGIAGSGWLAVVQVEEHERG